MTTVNTQRLGAVVRQILALAAVTMGVLTASVTSLHLPTAVSSILVVVGGVIMAIEHYVSDPSTGTPAAPSTPTVPPTP